jgi:hypothetical protein
VANNADSAGVLQQVGQLARFAHARPALPSTRYSPRIDFTVKTAVGEDARLVDGRSINRGVPPLLEGVAIA